MDAPSSRQCTKCRLDQPVDCFSADRGGRDGLRSQCKTCRKAAYDAWRNRNRQHLRDYQREYERRTKRASWLKTKYGITPEDFEQMLAVQQGLCGICRQPQKKYARFMDVDHCHTTGRVRGLLCRSCNTALGLLGDDPARIRALSEYLSRHQ